MKEITPDLLPPPPPHSSSVSPYNYNARLTAFVSMMSATYCGPIKSRP